MDNQMEIYAKKSATRKNGVSQKCIDQTEAILNIKLDQQYVDLMKIVNAPHYGSWLFHPIKDSTNLRKTFDDIVRNTNLERENGLSKDYIVIAENGTGNFLCLKTGEKEIYHQHHEYLNPKIIFRDLKEFIDNCEKFDS